MLAQTEMSIAKAHVKIEFKFLLVT